MMKNLLLRNNQMSFQKQIKKLYNMMRWSKTNNRFFFAVCLLKRNIPNIWNVTCMSICCIHFSQFNAIQRCATTSTVHLLIEERWFFSFYMYRKKCSLKALLYGSMLWTEKSGFTVVQLWKSDAKQLLSHSLIGHHRMSERVPITHRKCIFV